VNRPARKVLLLSAYDAVSHRLWRQSLLTMFPEFNWTVLTLPPRHFAWRIRGNSLSWAFNHRGLLTDNHDFLVVTSMVDLTALRGFVPELSRLPTLVYFHENQFAYPIGDRQFVSVEPQILNLYTALCADKLVFNSDWNRQSFLNGVRTLLKNMPDHVPARLIERLQHAQVLAVPLADELFDRTEVKEDEIRDRKVLNIVWNHRWEYDKGPALLLAIVDALIAADIRFCLHLLGERFRRSPAEFTEISAKLASFYQHNNIAPGHRDYLAERRDYEQVLRAADVVLSTADHDFQGLSLLEGIACGCTPLAPARLVYPEYLSTEFLYSGSADPAIAAASAVSSLKILANSKLAAEPLPRADIAKFRQSQLKDKYEILFSELQASATDQSSADNR
jgi:glycosyltransferase involved in cell wall biosynthesis